jgi:hypothetical protein
MSHPTKVPWAGKQGVTTALLILTLVLLLAPRTANAQQTYVSRFNLFTGYTFLDSPHVSLFENGFHTQAGVNAKTWLALGFDYSISGGSLSLTPGLLTPTLQTELAGILQLMGLPATYPVSVPTDSLTQTFAGGPQLEYRHFKQVTIFFRPSIGAIHELATAEPGTNSVNQVIVGALETGGVLAANGKKTDTTIFYGGGGGADFNFSKHISLRVQADLVYDHLFSDTLKDGRMTVRFSVGPTFNFGKNIKK